MDQSVPPGRVRGICIPPCSKSYAQRALAASLLAEGTSRLHNIEFCDDTRSAIRCIEALGARVRRTGERTLEIDGGLSPAGDKLYVGQSGLSTRLFTPIASLCDTPIGVVGEGPLLHRSFRTMIRTLRALGVWVHDRNDHLPLHIQGPIRGGEVQVEGLVSSQFITGLLLALPIAEEETTIHVPHVISTPYIDITIDTAERFGIAEGDYVWIENDHGRFRQRARLSLEVNEQTVHAEHGWWFPEQDGAEPNFYGAYDSNLNNMTEAFRTGQGGIGFAIKRMLCKIYPVQEGDVLPHEVIAEKGDFAPYEPGKPYEPVEEPVVTVMS